MQGETARVTFATRLHSGPPIFADRNTIGNHMNKGQKNTVVRIAASALLLGTAWLPLLSPALHIALCAAAYLVIGADILFRAVRNILHGKIFDENFLMSVATVGAFAIGEYPEAVAVMLFYQTGELFQDMAVVRSRKSIAALMDIRPDYANLEDARGELHRVAPDDVPAGSIIVTKPGEKIPLDGVIVAGSSALDTAALTGESLPKEVTEHDIVLSGSLNMTGLLRIRTTGVYGESTVARILDLVENADTGKAATEKFITRFARYYTPAVVIAALLLAVVPPLLAGGDWLVWLNRALIFLVISCPCALVVSIPLTFFRRHRRCIPQRDSHKRVQPSGNTGPCPYRRLRQDRYADRRQLHRHGRPPGNHSGDGIAGNGRTGRKLLRPSRGSLAATRLCPAAR